MTNIWERTDSMWPPDTTRGSQINIIAMDSDPHILRNVARYYDEKRERWADALAAMLRKAAEPANDNVRTNGNVRKRAFRHRSTRLAGERSDG